MENLCRQKGRLESRFGLPEFAALEPLDDDLIGDSPRSDWGQPPIRSIDAPTLSDEGLVLGSGRAVRVNARAHSAKDEWSPLESVRLSQPSGTMLLFR